MNWSKNLNEVRQPTTKEDFNKNYGEISIKFIVIINILVALFLVLADVYPNEMHANKILIMPNQRTDGGRRQNIKC